MSSALVVIWQFRGQIPEDRERFALRLIALSFLALAVWISLDALRPLFGAGDAQPSPVGIGLAAASVIVMPVLAWAKQRTGRELGSATVVADSTQTLLCTYLSGLLVIGLLLNQLLGWSPTRSPPCSYTLDGRGGVSHDVTEQDELLVKWLRPT